MRPPGRSKVLSAQREAMHVKHLFSPEGGLALAAAMALHPLLAFDFDGTLTPIVARPEDARLSVAVGRRLEALACRLPVAIISGRSIEDLRTRMSFEPHYLLGSHGAEDPGAPPSEVQLQALDAARAQLRAEAGMLAAAGVRLEDKQHSLALHYRLARDREQAQQVIHEVKQRLGPGVLVYGGKQVVNVVAAGAPDKGLAVQRLLARSGARAAVFVGDDVNDEPVFERAEPTWLTVRVGRDAQNTAARFCLDHCSEVAAMLDRLLAVLEAEPASLPGPLEKTPGRS